MPSFEESIMNADEILAQVRERGEQSESWIVFPLLRNKLILAILGWIGSAVMGGGLLALVVPVVIPGNYERGVASAIITTLILAMIAFIFVGSLFLLITDIRRLREIGKHVIVVTDTDFVKQEGAKIIQVPLSHVRYVTARGRAPAEDKSVLDPGTKDGNTSLPEIPRMRDNLTGMFMGRGASGSAKARRKRMRTPTSLAFIDARTEKEVTVVNDNAYGDPFFIAAILKERAAAAATMYAG
jgi:hypothetical protein